MSHILIVDDEKDIRESLASWLTRNQFEVSVASSGVEALEIYRRTNIDIILTDVNMPGMTGIELVKEIRKIPGSEFVPTMFLSAMTSERDQKLGYEIGADSYICKPLKREQRPIIIAMIKSLVERSQKCKNHQNDYTTGLPTKEYFYDCLGKYLRSLGDGREEVISLAILDIDFFKKVNDENGHQVGDIILKEFAETIKANLRRSDAAFRFGGEEFCVIMPGATEQIAIEIIQRLYKIVREKKFHESLDIRFSTGLITTYTKEISLEQIFISCDGALYEAKKNGRDRIEVAPTLIKEAS